MSKKSKTPPPKTSPAPAPVEDEDDDLDDDDDDDDDDDEDSEPPAPPLALIGGPGALGAALGGQRLAKAVARRKADEPDQFDLFAAWLGRNGAVPALLALVILCCAMYRGLFTGELNGDDLTFHLAESARLSDCIRAGDFDWWNPSGNAGYASAYYYQVIPQLASAVPAAIFGHLLFWFQLSNFLPLVLAPVAAYRGMRLLGATPWQSFAGAFVVALMNGESRWGSGAAGSFNVGLYTQTWALSAFPLALGYGGHFLVRGKKLAPAVAWGAFVGLCHPFAVIGLGIALAVAVVARALPTRTGEGHWPSWIGGLLVFAGIGTLLVPPALPWLPNVAIPAGFIAAIALVFAVPVRGSRWVARPVAETRTEAARLCVLGALMILAWMPVWLPLLADYQGFGGFPHRVGDEIGPGFTTLLDWHVRGHVLDFTSVQNTTRWPVLTWMLPLVVSFARAPVLRWLWAPALLFALFLGIGPHMSTTQDDLLPMVRFLGAMQTLLALGIGAGAVHFGSYLWRIAGKTEVAYILRTIIASLCAASLILVSVTGFRALEGRIHTMPGYPTQHHDELLQIGEKLASLPPGRKQAGPGTENHWWNLLTYVYGRTPALLQMGGGGLQSSPVYDFLWTQRDFAKNAWIYDAPYVVFARDKADKAPVGDTVFASTMVRLKPHFTTSILWPEWEVVSLQGNYFIRRLPSAGLVSPVEVTGVLPPGTRKGQPGHDAALEWIKSDLPLADHVLAYDGFGGISAPPDGHLIAAHRQLSPGDEPDIVAEVQANKPTTFVVRESWHPRWHGYIDGVEVPVRRVTPDFPALEVPEGHHELSLRFERPWWALADWLAWPAFSLLGFFGLRRWRRTHPLPAEV